MLISEFYLKAIKSSAVKRKHWIFSVFSITEDVRVQQDYPYKVVRTDDSVSFIDPEQNNALTKLDDADPKAPIAAFRQPILLPGQWLANAPNPIETTFGNVLVNHLMLCIPFKDTIPFQEGYVNVGNIEKIILRNLIDDPEDPEADWYAPDGKIYVRQFQQFGVNAQSLVAYNNISVHSVTRKSLLYHPDAEALKLQLMEQYKDQLTDPAIIARISKELERMDREWLKGDPSEDFYIKNKYFTVIRKKLHYAFGDESPFSDGSTVKFLSKPLREGIDFNEYPTYINSLREGSYNRGAMTQLGGAATKEVYRTLSPIVIEGDDCGTTLGIPRVIRKNQMHDWIGSMAIDAKGKSFTLTEEYLTANLGKVLTIRSPMFCKQKAPGLCAACLGKQNSEIRNGLPAAAADSSTALMSASLAAVHGVELKTVPYDIDMLIS